MLLVGVCAGVGADDDVSVCAYNDAGVHNDVHVCIMFQY